MYVNTISSLYYGKPWNKQLLFPHGHFTRHLDGSIYIIKHVQNDNLGKFKGDFYLINNKMGFVSWSFVARDSLRKRELVSGFIDLSYRIGGNRKC